MINLVTVHSHYLPAEAAQWIAQVCQIHPFIAGATILLSFGLVFWVLRRRFGRGGTDIVATTLFIVTLAIFSAACLYLLFTRPGYHVFHPGF